MDDPPGICQKLTSFIFGMLSRSNLPEEDSSRDEKNPNGYYSSSEIVIEFNHADGSESWTHIHDGSVHRSSSQKDGRIMSEDQTLMQNGLENKEKKQVHFSTKTDHETGEKADGRTLQDLDALKGKDAKGIGLKKRKEVNQLTEEATMVSNQPHEDRKPRPPRRLSPLQSVASNINEKSDEYIDKMKKAMRRNTTHES